MNTIVATTTWDCADLIETFLRHCQRFEIHQVLVMDFDSTDGTREVLTSPTWRSFVTLVPFPGISGLDSSNRLLAVAKASHWKDHWCLFCDPDEFLVTPSMTVNGPALAAAAADAMAMVLPRFNVTAERSIAKSYQDRLSLEDAITLRIDRRCTRSVESDMLQDILEPPWIFSDIPGKALATIEGAARIGDGDHTVETSGRLSPVPDGIYLLHYPFRSFRSFADKIARAESDFRANPDLAAVYGWQLRRWIRLASQGVLHQEYLQQFIADADVASFVANGTVVRDRSLAAFHQRL